MTSATFDSASTTDEASALDAPNWTLPVRRFLYVIGLIDRGIQREVQRAIADEGLAVSEFTVLSVLLVSPGLSNAQLARRALVTPQSMNEVIAGLERRGLVARRPHPDHGRIRMVEVTDEGRRVFEAVHPAVVELEATLLDGLDDETIDVLRDSLLGVLDKLRDRA